jgi:hypothetical protein
MVRAVDRSFYKNYLKKAEELLYVAEYAVSKSKNTAAVMASIHCAINAIDALAVFSYGKRHSGSHEDALDVIKGAVSESEFKELAKQFKGLFELKNEAEYQPDLMDKRQAGEAVKRASRILSKLKDKLR